MKADLEFGQVAGLKIDVLTETGWFDDGTFKGQMMAYGGTEQSQSGSLGIGKTPAATPR